MPSNSRAGKGKDDVIVREEWRDVTGTSEGGKTAGVRERSSRDERSGKQSEKEEKREKTRKEDKGASVQEKGGKNGAVVTTDIKGEHDGGKEGSHLLGNDKSPTAVVTAVPLKSTTPRTDITDSERGKLLIITFGTTSLFFHTSPIEHFRLVWHVIG